jgi:hypothetical protein
MIKIEKIFSEVRFSGQISVIEDIGKIVRLFYPTEFNHWQIDNNVIVRLFNDPDIKKATEIILVDHSKFVYSSENNPTQNYFKDKFLKYYKKFEKFIESSEVVRVGLRSYTLLEQKSKEETIKKYDSIFTNDFISSFNIKPVDYYDVLQFENQRIVFGPLSKDEKNQYIIEFNNKDDFKNDMVLFDIDCFRKKVKKSNIVKIIEHIFKENRYSLSILENKFGEN